MTLLIRLSLLILFLVEVVVGFWNQVFPASFYEHFPTVDLTPPYSEHPTTFEVVALTTANAVVILGLTAIGLTVARDRSSNLDFKAS